MRCRKSQVWVKLSNSGDALKILILNHIWKYMSGWSNYSGIVTSQNMNESVMGYRGSKSVILNCVGIAVKEQRVYGSWCGGINLPHLRCTLTGFERNYQIKILSNQTRLSLLREFSSISSESLIKNPALDKSSCPLDPWFITGFVDGEGSFIVRVRKNPKYRIGFVVEAYFSITLHKKDLKILQDIQSYFGVGKIRNEVNDKVKFRVESLKDIVNKVIPHFEKYSLITQKLADYSLFRDDDK